MESSKVYQVLICSNQVGLSQARHDLREILAERRCVATGLSVPADADEQLWVLNSQQLRDADYVIVLMGGSYGAITETGVGHVHRLFSQAIALNKPVVSLIKMDSQEDATDPVDAMRAKNFLAQLQRQPHEYYADVQTYREAASRAVERMLSQAPARGWQPVGATNASELSQEVERQRLEIDKLRRDLQAMTAKSFEAWLDEDVMSSTQVLNFSVKKYQDGNVSTIRETVTVTGEQLLTTLAPAMATPATDAHIYVGFCERLLERLLNQLKVRFPDAHAFLQLKVVSEDFDKVRAWGYTLNLMENSDGRWRLTAHGTHQMSLLLSFSR
ncbi:DUF4062 domain-containing protein [Salinibius halmophilus]|uniref:DUF4062 domain-containing protein n=1 Tax=Salinibius halmophilus TaxID=1853216 RepID=UPI000E66EBCA|nr:DUF4062 domain-containing protein [Salinibius halmophilus]